MLTESDSVCPRDGASPEEQTLTPLPESLAERYQDAEPYAHGATGSSYLATQKDSGFRGLLKILPATDQGASERSRLKRELRKQTKLTNNSLVRIIDGGEIDKTLWLFRDLAAGESLTHRLQAEGKLEVDEALAIVAQVASALDELHRGGLLHRDVKPSHIILEPREEAVPLVKLVDAGLAARIETGAVFDLMGTPAYMSPEQASGKLVSFRSDLYALGCVLHEMLTGEPPFGRDDATAVLEAQKSQEPPAIDRELPSAVETLLGALLAKEPRKRPFSAQQVRRTLDPLLPDSTPSPLSATRTSAGSVAAPSVVPGGGARRAPPPPVPGQSRERDDPTQEIELEEIEAAPPAPPPPDAPQATIRLDPEEVDALSVDVGEPEAEAATADEDEAAAGAETPDDSAAEASAEEAAPAAETPSLPPPPPSLGPVAVPPAAGQAPEPAGSLPAPAPAGASEAASTAEAPEAAGDETASGDAAASAEDAGRPSIDFDVESLFEDDVPEEPRAEDAAEDAKTGLYQAASDAKKTEIYRPPSPEERAQEPTVVVPVPAERKLPVVPIAVGLAALLLMWAIFGGENGPEEVSAGAAEGGEGAAPSAAEAAGEGEGGGDKAGQPAAAQAETEPAPAEAAEGEQGEEAPDKTAEAEPEAEEGGEAAEGEAEQAPEEAAEGPAEETAEATEEGEASASASDGDRQRRKRRERAAPARAKPPAKGGPETRKEKAATFKQQGREHYQAGRYREAAKAYEQATRYAPSDAGAFAGLGASSLAAGNAADAIRAYQRAVRLNPRSSGFQAALGRAYYQKGDSGRARSAYQRALELNPNNAAAKAAMKRLK